MPNLKQFKTMINRIAYRNRYRTKNRVWTKWVFGEWFGTKCNDSCLSLANYVSDHYPNIDVFWIANRDCQGLNKLNKRISIVEKDSTQSINLLKKAGVVFVNEGLQDLTENGYNYSSGAIIVNLWHGVPWKKIGMDSYKKNQYFTKLYARTIFKSQDFSYFPSSSELCTQCLLSGFILKPDNIIKAGLPRNSIFYSETELKEIRNNLIKSIPSKSDIIDDNTKIISYLPTFRDKTQNSFNFQNMEKINELIRILNDNNAIIIQKSHIANQRRNDGFEDTITDRIITWNDCSAQELMASSDILITDYSSCFFDFLLLDRPIIHYIYDYDYYSGNDRGLYYKKEDVVCGDAVISEEDLLKSISNNLNNPNKDFELRKMRRTHFLSYENSNSCKTISEHVLNRINLVEH